jgi:hypothetical protein
MQFMSELGWRAGLLLLLLLLGVPLVQAPRPLSLVLPTSPIDSDTTPPYPQEQRQQRQQQLQQPVELSRPSFRSWILENRLELVLAHGEGEGEEGESTSSSSADSPSTDERSLSPASPYLTRIAAPSGLEEHAEWRMLEPHPSPVSLPTIQGTYGCLMRQDQACLHALRAHFSTFSQPQMLGILMAAHPDSHNTLFQDFVNSPLVPLGDRLVVSYALISFTTLCTFVLDYHDVLAHLKDRTFTLEQWKHLGSTILHKARTFNAQSLRYLERTVEASTSHERERLREMRQGGTRRIRANLAHLNRLEQAMEEADSPPLYMTALRRFFAEGQEDLIVANGVSKRFLDAADGVLGEGRGADTHPAVLLAHFRPSLDERVALGLNEEKLMRLWAKVVRLRRFDLLLLLVEEEGLCNLARAQVDERPYLRVLVRTLARYPWEVVHPSWPSNRAVVEWVVLVGGPYVLYPELLEDVVVQLRDADVTAYVRSLYPSGDVAFPFSSGSRGGSAQGGPSGGSSPLARADPDGAVDLAPLPLSPMSLS